MTDMEAIVLSMPGWSLAGQAADVSKMALKDKILIYFTYDKRFRFPITIALISGYPPSLLQVAIAKLGEPSCTPISADNYVGPDYLWDMEWEEIESIVDFMRSV